MSRFLTKSLFERWEMMWSARNFPMKRTALVAIIRQIAKSRSSNINVLVEQEDAFDVNAMNGRTLKCHYCRGAHLMSECPEVAQLKQLTSRVDRLETGITTMQNDMNNGFQGIIEKISALATQPAQVNSSEQQTSNRPRRGPRGPQAPFCTLCELEPSGCPPRHWAQQCPRQPKH